MPYIKKEDRDFLITFTGTESPSSAGELNYCITSMILGYQDKNKLSYKTINEIVGVLECAKQEYYRRVAVPYEESKIRENGDVYPI